MSGLLIGVPTLNRPLTLDWAMAFKSLNPPINYNTIFSVVKGKPVAEARNLMCEEAIKHNCKYILFIGDDTIIPNHALKQFIFRMENTPDCGVVGGVYFSKTDPSAPLVFKGNGEGSYWDWKVGEFFNVTGLGMDCTMIRVDILKEVSKPWFHTKEVDTFLDAINSVELWTEDLYFLHKVTEETKWKVYCDAGVIADHVDVYTGRVYSLPHYSLPTRNLAIPKDEKKVVDLGCGHIWREFPECTKPVRVDIDEGCRPDYRCDVRTLPFANEEFDIVFSSHVLEHFSRDEHHFVLAEWLRILKPTGELRLVLPNIMWAAEQLVKRQGEFTNDILNVFYGGQMNKFDFHYNGFTPKYLKDLLHSKGYFVSSWKEEGYNILANFQKAGTIEVAKTIE